MGHEIEVFTDHKNLVYKNFNTERVMQWRLLIEEFGPKLTYIKGENNIVADALSRLRLKEVDFSLEAFAADDETSDFPTDFPLSYAQIAHEQNKDVKLQDAFVKTGQTTYVKETFRHSDKSYELITRKKKIVLPKHYKRKL